MIACWGGYGFRYLNSVSCRSKGSITLAVIGKDAIHPEQRFPTKLILCGKFMGQRTIFVIRHSDTERIQGITKCAATEHSSQ